MSAWSELALAQRYARLRGESRLTVLHPALREIVRSLPDGPLLDFGCADGALFCPDLPPREVVLYDPSAAMITEAMRVCADQANPPCFLSASDDIPESHFAVVVCSLVLMTLSSRAAVAEAMRQIRHALRPGGAAVIAVTHPCFRNVRFSTFENDFSERGEFDYAEEGTPFRVRLQSGDGDAVEFVDYHWTLAETFRQVLLAHLTITDVRELGDVAGGATVPAYLVITARAAGPP